MLGNCRRLGVELLLIAFAAVMAIGFLVTYVVAVSKDHVYPYFPYISDTGADAPESCIFTLVCSVGGILVLFIMYIRYKHIHEHYKESAAKVTCWNSFGLVVGVLSVLGILIVGSFQDDKVTTVHFIGAFMVFGFGVVYEWVQLLVSYRIFRTNLSPSSKFVEKCVLLLRFAFAATGTLCFFATTVVGPLIRIQDPKHWTASEKHYPLHIFSTVCEWIMALTFLLYFLTFHPDFALISVDFSVKARYHHSDSLDSPVHSERTPLNY